MAKANQFGRVDQTENPEFFIAYLERTSERDFFKEQKRRSFQAMEVQEGDRVLDVGCGTGDDVRALAELVGTTGSAVGVDSSQVMIAEAKKRSGQTGLPTEFRLGNAEELDLPDASFDACRAERVLLHLGDPPRAVSEMWRVLEPGGRVVLWEPDWETATLDAADKVLTRTLLRAHCEAIRCGWAGRQLSRWVKEAGFVDVTVSPATIVEDYAGIKAGWEIDVFARQAAAAGLVSPEEVERWLGSLEHADKAGTFFASLTAFMVSGRRP